MCIVIDTNTFPSVFKTKSADHYEFKPVWDWIMTGKGFIVYGGTKYNKELMCAGQYFRIFAELKTAGKAFHVEDKKVDREQILVREIEPRRCFDDPHLIAIFRVSKCKLLCTKDARSDKFIKDPKFYNNGQKPPRIYRTRRHHEALLCDRNIIHIQNRI